MEASVAASGGASVVLVGRFNPAIFQPHWFASASVVAPAEADAASDSPLISADLTVLQFPTFTVEALRERVTFATASDTPTANLVRDAAVNVFTILSHTPIRLVGMNTAHHFDLPEGGWARIEEALSPDETRGRVLEGGHLGNITVRGPRHDPLNGHVQVVVEPSVLIAGGMWIQYNSHVDLGEEIDGAATAVEVLEEHWEDSMAQSTAIAETIRGLA